MGVGMTEEGAGGTPEFFWIPAYAGMMGNDGDGE